MAFCVCRTTMFTSLSSSSHLCDEFVTRRTLQSNEPAYFNKQLNVQCNRVTRSSDNVIFPDVLLLALV